MVQFTQNYESILKENEELKKENEFLSNEILGLHAIISKYNNVGKSSNELRAEIIEKAKLFLSEEKGTVFEFIIQDKRILVLNNEEKLFAESECHPDDAFNEHIGKAIALGRALGKDVSEFENAVQPDEVVVGHVVNGDEARGIYTQECKFTLTSKRGCDAFYYAEGEDGRAGVEDDFIYNWQIGDIIDDTNAIYKEGTE